MKRIVTFAHFLDGNDLWISQLKYNALFRLNLKSEKVEYVHRFENHSPVDGELHFCAGKHNDTLFFFPQYCNTIDWYDISSGLGSYTDIPEMDKHNGKAIIAGHVYENSIIMVPRYKDVPLMVFSVEEKKVVDCIILEQATQCNDVDCKDLTYYSCMIDNTIYFPIRNTNCIGSYDVENRKERIYKLNNINEITGDFKYDGRDIWLNADDGIYKWNPNTEEFNVVFKCAFERHNWIESILFHDDLVVCVPRWLGTVNIINKNTLEIKEVSVDTNALTNNFDIPWRDIKGCLVWDEKLIILPVKFTETIYIDLNSFDVTYKKILLDNYNPLDDNISLQEQNKENLQELMTYIKEHNVKKSSCNYLVGKSIWEDITR